jgi:spermidine synthase
VQLRDGDAVTYIFVFVSGLASLIYQVLWMKQLGLLFGSTAYAAGATLAAFFAGLAAGSWFWGRRSAKAGNPLRVYAGLEAGIVLAALFYFVILRAYYAIYPSLYQSVDSEALLLAVRFGLSLLLIFPPAFCMGGTIPVMGQHLIRNRSTFGTTSALLYAVNTLGAALGAGLAGFFLPLWFGYKLTCVVAMLATGAVAAGAFMLSRRPSEMREEPSSGRERDTETESAGGELAPRARPGMLYERASLNALCFLSGFGFLALEVLWTRMFSQVLENSVYTFAAILVIVLLCLAGGALISSRLARLQVSTATVLTLLVLVSGVAVALTPFLFMWQTHAFQIVALKGSWSAYLALIFRKGFLTIGLPALMLGTVFPYLMKIEETRTQSAGASLGRLAAINTAGAILGSLACGFVFIEVLGMWRTMRLIAVIYLVTVLVLPIAWNRAAIALKSFSILFLVLIFTILDPAGLPVSSVDALRPHEEILETWEGSDCTVAVVRDPHGLSIKVNSHYGLGSTGALMQEKLQADLPLYIYPDTESIFFLGMGTGITAGSALDSQFAHVKRVVACELVPEVITAAKTYMTDVEGYDFTGGLFSDPRATILAEDGRHYLMATRESFDMINADLFVPFRSGVGSLYSREHFQSAKDRLAPGGVLFQWLPLYQLTETEFMIIARTMLEVFDQVSLWRNNFQIGEEVIALAGHQNEAPLPACTLDSRADKQFAVAGKGPRDLYQLSLPLNAQTILFFYGGNVSESRDLFSDYPINTDDRPMIEYGAPRSYRDQAESAVPWFVGPRIIRLIEGLQTRCPPERDPLLALRSAENRRLPAAGMAFHRARLWGVIGDEKACAQSWHRFLRDWTP